MRSIQSKITLYVAGSLLLLFMLLLWTIDMEMDKTIVPLSKNLTNQIVNARAEQISNWIEERSNEIQLIGNDIHHLDMDIEDGLDHMNFILGNNQTYESLGIVDSYGVAWITDGSKFSIANREYYKKIIEENLTFVISNPIKSQSNRADIVIMMYKLPYNNKYGFKYISAAVPIETIKNIAENIHLYDGGSKIYDKWGNPIGGGLSIDNNDENFVSFKALIDKSPDWTLVFRVPEDRLYEGTRKLQSAALIIGGLVGGALILLLIFFSSSIVAPIRRLQNLMRKVETGNLTVRLEEKRRDEIGDLGRSFNQMLDKLYKVQYEKREIELRLLQEQIKPHFLYNTLDTIRWAAIEYEANEVVDLIEALSTYFRIGLSKGKNFISLSEELDHIESYLQIQQARYEEFLQYEIRYDESLVEEKVIRILLQPLVENAIYHGIKQDENDENKICKIIINIFSEEDNLIMEVKNNGRQIDEVRLEKIQSTLDSDEKQGEQIGFGLYSVNHRLKLAFGDKYGLVITNEDDWTVARIRCPLIKGED